MTTLSLTGTLMINCASISLLGGNFYDKTNLNNKFSLKADLSELTLLVAIDHLELNCTNSDDLTIDYYKKTDIGNMLLSYSTGSYVDYTLANKVSTIGDATISGNLDVGSTGNNSIKIHGTGATTSFAEFRVSNGQNCVWDFQNPSNSNVWSSIKVKSIKFMGFSHTDNIILMHKATRIHGSLNIGCNQDATPCSMSNVKTYFTHVGSSVI